MKKIGTLQKFCRVANFCNLQNFTGCEISQVENFRNLRCLQFDLQLTIFFYFFLNGSSDIFVISLDSDQYISLNQAL